MSPPGPDDRLPEEADVTAAELALGVLAGAEREAAEARARDETAFAAAVARWRRRFAHLTPEAVPPPWPSVAARLPATGAVLPPARELRRWRRFAVAAAAAAAILAALLLAPFLRPRPTSLAATLTGPTSTATVAVDIDPASGRLVVQPAALQGALANRVAELWVIPADGRPRSLGLIDPAAPRAFAARPEARASLEPDATLAVSLEPPGGSPTGQPTGPVLLSGRISRL